MTTWEKIHGHPIEQATEEDLRNACRLLDDGYIEHHLIMAAMEELIRRKIIEDPFKR